MSARSVSAQAVAQARHHEMVEAARNDGWIDGMIDNNNGSWTPARYRFRAYAKAYHEGLKTGTTQRKIEGATP